MDWCSAWNTYLAVLCDFKKDPSLTFSRATIQKAGEEQQEKEEKEGKEEEHHGSPVNSDLVQIPLIQMSMDPCALNAAKTMYENCSCGRPTSRKI